MAQYFIRKFDDDLYRRVKIQAAKDEMTVKAVILKLLSLYTVGKVKLV